METTKDFQDMLKALPIEAGPVDIEDLREIYKKDEIRHKQTMADAG